MKARKKKNQKTHQTRRDCNGWEDSISAFKTKIAITMKKIEQNQDQNWDQNRDISKVTYYKCNKNSYKAKDCIMLNN